MGVPLRVVEHPDMGEHSGVLRLALPEYGWTVQPGDMWPVPRWDEPERECWAIVLPNLHVWYTTDRAGGLWDLAGTAPDITVSPSINCEGGRSWHGWIRNGELVDA